jgi:hypothetical protein
LILSSGNSNHPSFQIINEVKLPQEDRASYLEIFPSNGALLCGTNRGSIYVIKTPLSNAPTGIFHYLAHSARITKVSFVFSIYFRSYFIFRYRSLLHFMKRLLSVAVKMVF